MEPYEVLEAIRSALHRINHPRFFKTERGYQGALVAELTALLSGQMQASGDIIEQEHQKRLRFHGLSVRPDIVIHQPFDPNKHKGFDEGNRAVIEIKRCSTQSQATADFESLESISNVLNYPLAIFINIASNETHVEIAPASLSGRLICFAVNLQDSDPNVIERQA